MQRRKAVLVDLATRQPICPEWRPTILPSELEHANHSLQQAHLSYRWQWADRVTTLHGAVEMQAKALNADVQLRPAGQRC